jgi:hypothetical protein
MSEDDTPGPEAENPKPNPWVRLFVAGLPLGLIVMGAISFLFYFHKRNAARETRPSQYASMMQKDLNLEDFQRYVKILDKDIGPRTPEHPGNVEAAQSFIQSTLGYDNMGYQVVRRELGKDAGFEAGMKGEKTPQQLVLICARYDNEHAESIATLFCLAQAVTGTKHRNTVRFFAFSGGDSLAQSGKLAEYKDWSSKEEFDRVITLYIANPGETPVSLGGPVVKLAAPSMDDPGALGVLTDNEGLLQKYGSAVELK